MLSQRVRRQREEVLQDRSRKSLTPHNKVALSSNLPPALKDRKLPEPPLPRTARVEDQKTDEYFKPRLS